MGIKRILAMAAVFLSLATVANTIAQARDDDMRGEERRADWQHERKAETNLAVPRNADGTIDAQGFVNEVDSLVARGVRVIHFRDAGLTQEEAGSMLLRIDGNLLGDLAERLPNDGIQRQITLRGDVDVRVQRQSNGELRARIDDLVVGNPTEARRAEFTEQLAKNYGIDRLTIRAVDAEGNRLRVEYRADRGIVRNEARSGHGGDREHHADGHDKRKAEAKLDVPRNADGTIDGRTFVNEVDSLVARGVKVIHFRDASITQEEARSLLIPLEGNLIGHLAARLPNDGIQRQITLRGDVDVRVQRKANGELRASIKDLVVGNPTEARRAEFALQLAERYGLDRLSVRAIDAEGNRLRVEYRADQGIVRNESRPGHRQVEGGEIEADRGNDKHRGKHQTQWGNHHGRGDQHAQHGRDRNSDRAEWRYDDKDRDERHAKAERKDRDERHAKAERKDRDERHAKVERKEFAERPERREDRMQRPEQHAKFERPDRHERAERPERREDRMQRPERHAKFERPERHERVERPERHERVERPERVERVERPDRASRH